MRDGASQDVEKAASGALPLLIVRVLSLTTVLATLIGTFFPGTKIGDVHLRYGYIIAGLVVTAHAGYEIWRRRHRPPPETPLSPIPIETSLLRAFLPFERGDTLIGRRDDLAEALTIVQSMEFRFGVIWGESGCGKTSFLRAGLVAALAGRGTFSVYLSRPTDDPVAAIREAFLAHTGPGRGYVIVDQFEEFFLTHPGHSQTQRLGIQFRELLDANPRSALVLAIRRDFFARLQHLAPAIADPTSPQTTFELGNLSTKAAQEVLVQAAAAESIQFELALVDAVIEDLQADGQVWPVELQLLGTRLKRARVREKSVYIALGRKAGVIGTYIRDELARLPKPILGEIVLRKLCAHGAIAKSPVDISLDAIAADVRARDPSLMAGTDLAICLRKLQEARIVIQTGDDTFNLTHDALAPLIARGTTGVQGQTEAADRSISFYLAAFRQDRAERIPIRTLLQIRRHATPVTLADAQVRELLRKSWVSAGLNGSLPAALVILLLIGTGYLTAFNSWSLGTAPAYIPTGPPSIVIRSGSPLTRFLPGADRVIAETVFGEDQLDAGSGMASIQVPRGELWGFGSALQSIPVLAGVLDPLDGIAALRQGGQPAAAAAAFVALANGKQQADYQLKLASDEIGLVGRADGDAGAKAAGEVLSTQLAAKSESRWTTQFAATLALLRIAENHTNAADRVELTLPEALAVLRQKFHENASEHSAPDLDVTLIDPIIEQLVLNGRVPPGVSDLAAFGQILAAPQNDAYVRSTMLRLFYAYTARNEKLAVPALAYLLDQVAARTNIYPQFKGETMSTIEGFARAYPNAVRDPEIKQLLAHSWLADTKSDVQMRAIMVPGLAGLFRADPSLLPDGFVDKVKALVDDPRETLETRRRMSIALMYLATTSPGLANFAQKRFRGLFQSAIQIRKIADKVPLREAVAASAALAGTGRADPDIVAFSLRLLGQAVIVGGEGRRREYAYRSARDLTHLVRAGGRVDEQLVASIVQTIVDPPDFPDADEAGDLLIVAAKTSPLEVLRLHAKLDKANYTIGRYRYAERTQRARVLAAYGQADAVIGDARQRADRCKGLLDSVTNAQAWQRGAYCAFFVAVDDPATLPRWKTYLRGRASIGVAEGMAARMALEMLTNVQRIADARATPANAALIRARLRYDLDTRVAHIGIAARTALLVLDVDGL